MNQTTSIKIITIIAAFFVGTTGFLIFSSEKTVKRLPFEKLSSEIKFFYNQTQQNINEMKCKKKYQQTSKLFAKAQKIINNKKQEKTKIQWMEDIKRLSDIQRSIGKEKQGMLSKKNDKQERKKFKTKNREAKNKKKRKKQKTPTKDEPKKIIKKISKKTTKKQGKTRNVKQKTPKKRTIKKAAQTNIKKETKKKASSFDKDAAINKYFQNLNKLKGKVNLAKFPKYLSESYIPKAYHQRILKTYRKIKQWTKSIDTQYPTRVYTLSLDTKRTAKKIKKEKKTLDELIEFTKMGYKIKLYILNSNKRFTYTYEKGSINAEQIKNWWRQKNKKNIKKLKQKLQEHNLFIVLFFCSALTVTLPDQQIGNILKDWESFIKKNRHKYYAAITQYFLAYLLFLDIKKQDNKCQKIIFVKFKKQWDKCLSQKDKVAFNINVK